MAKLYSKKELADIYRQANPGHKFETLSDDDVLKDAAQQPGGDKFIARLAPPPAPEPTKIQKIKDLAVEGYKNLMKPDAKATAEKPEVPFSEQIRAAAQAAKDMMLPRPEIPPAAVGAPPLLKRPISAAVPELLRQPGWYKEPVLPPAAEPVKTVAGAVKKMVVEKVKGKPFSSINPPPEKLAAINEAFNVRPWVEKRIAKPVMRAIAPVGVETEGREIDPEDQDVIGRAAMEVVNEMIPMSPAELAGWVIGPKAIEIGVKGGLLALSKMAPKAALKAVSPIAGLGEVDALFSRLKMVAENKVGFRIPDSKWAPIQDDIARALLKSKLGVPIERVRPGEQPRPAAAPEAARLAAGGQPAPRAQGEAPSAPVAGRIKELAKLSEEEQLNATIRGEKPVYLTGTENPDYKRDISIARQSGLSIKEGEEVPYAFDNSGNVIDTVRAIVIYPPTNEAIAAEVLKTLKEPVSREYHKKLGRLLGYSEKEISDFLGKEPTPKEQAAEIRAGLTGGLLAETAPAGPAAQLMGFKDKAGNELIGFTKDAAETLAPWRWDYKGPDGKLYAGSASSKQIALAQIGKRFTIPPEQAPAEIEMPPAAPEKTVWNMPIEELQQKVLDEGWEMPEWKNNDEVAADMRGFPNGEYLRKWAAEENIAREGTRHKVPREIITKFKLEGEVKAMAEIEKGMREEVNQSLIEARGGTTPYLDLLKEMGYLNKKKVEAYIGVQTGKDWKGKEIPEELAWYIKPSGKVGLGELAHTAFTRGIAAENDITLVIEGLAQDREIKQALAAGEDISKILGTKRDMTEYGSAYMAKRKPKMDLPGQTVMPGTGPQWPNKKITAGENVDPDEFIAGFEAEAQTPGLFEAVKDAEAAAAEVKKIAGGEAAAEAPAVDEPAASFQPISTDKTFKLWRSTEQMIQKYAKRYGEDNYIPRGGVGVFYPDTKNIFLQAANNVFVAVHEVVHFVDDKTDWFKGLMRTTGAAKNGAPIYDQKTLPLRKLISEFYVETYPGASMNHPLKKRIKEGVAMLIQKAVESPEMLRDPKWIPLERAIIDPSGRYHNKIWPELIKDGRAAIEKYRGLDALQKTAARITEGGRVNGAATMFNGWDKAQTFLFDETHPFEKVEQVAGVPAAESPRLAMLAYRYYGSIANSNMDPSQGIRALIGDNVVKFPGDNIGVLFKKVGTLGNVEKFNAWLIDRRVRAGHMEMEVIRQRLIGITGGAYDIENYVVGSLTEFLKAKQAELSPEEFAGLEAAIRAQAVEYWALAKLAKNDNIGKDVAEQGYQQGLRDLPDIGEWAKIHDNINSVILEILNDAGYLTPDRYLKLKSNSSYASFRRDILSIAYESGQAATAGRAGFSIASLKARKGSEKAFIGPMYGLLENFLEATRKGMIQKAINKIHTMAVKHAEVLGGEFQPLKLQVVPRKGGGFDYPQLRNPNILMARKKGKYLPLAVADKDLLTVIENTMLDPHTAATVDKAVTMLTGVFTKGTVAYWMMYSVVNAVRDSITAIAQTQTSYKPLWSQARALAKYARDDESEIGKYLTNYLAITGGRQTLAHMYDGDRSPEQAYRWLTGELTKTELMLAGVEKLADIVATPSTWSEDFTRAMEFVNAKIAGDSDLVALEKAAYITGTFGHKGAWGGSKFAQVTVKAAAFMNPSFQMLQQFIKGHAEKKRLGRVLLTEAAIAAAIIASMYAIKTASKRQKMNMRGIPEGLRESAIWYPLPGATAREKGRLGKISIPENYAVMGNILNMMIMEHMGDDDFSGSEYFQASTAWLPDQLSPSQGSRIAFAWLPPFMQTMETIRTGKKAYPNVTELTPRILTGLPLEEQYTENTSALAKFTAKHIGDKMNLNPMEIDYLIEGTLGRSTRMITLRLGTRNFSNPLWSDLYLGATRDMEFYYKLRDQITAQENLFRNQIKDAAASTGRSIVLDIDADTAATIAAAADAGVSGEGPSKELLHLVQFKGSVAKIQAEIQQYRFYSRVKNPAPETVQERDKFRDLVLDDINLLRQEYEKKALTNTKR